nr:VOC family protein [Streptomyces lydicamycinicus]
MRAAPRPASGRGLATPRGRLRHQADPFAVRELLPGVDLADTARPGLGAVLWFQTSDAHQLHDQLTAAGIKILTPIADSPFGPMFSFEGPEGYTLTAHGG